ncbi:hypothetical protein NX059_010246 [Plenodomus lindquistii]|nr:hypothetical protein NX059_010246 [Plenodomus lindquistii]
MLSQTPSVYRARPLTNGPLMALHYNDSSDYEFDLDLRGRKHLVTTNDLRTVYTIGEAPQTAQWTFPISGAGNVTALRKSLQNHLPPHQITDEYGEIRPLVEISCHHLPSLQAKLWRGVSNDYMATMTAPTPPWTTSADADMAMKSSAVSDLPAGCDNTPVLATLLEAIASRLKDGYVFILDCKENAQCCNPTCYQREDVPHTLLLTLEPYFHWSTLTLASDLHIAQGKIVVFRRNGEKSDDPLWTLAIKQFNPADRVSYCVHCLQVAMDNKEAGWASNVPNITPSQCEGSQHGSPSTSHPSGLAWSDVHPAHRPTEFTFTSENHQDEEAEVHVLPRASNINTPASSHSNPQHQLSFQLDGTEDARTPTPRRTSPRFPKTITHQPDEKGIGFKPWSNGKEGDPKVGDPTPGHSHKHDGALTFRSITLSTNDATAQSPTIDRSISNPVQKIVSSSSVKRNTSLEQPKTRLTSPTVTSERVEQRRFGRELDTNIVSSLPKKPVSKKVANSAKIMDQVLQLSSNALVGTPAAPSNTRTHQTKTDTSPHHHVEAANSSSEPSETGESTGSSDTPTKTAPSLIPVTALPLKLIPETTTSRQRKDGGLKKTTPTKRSTTKQTPQSKPAKKAIPSPKALPAGTAPAKKPLPTTTKPQPPFAPAFARRPPLTDTDIPPNTDRATYEAHLRSVPSPFSKICICKQPARTHDVEIAQCANPACNIQWFHRGCLDKTGKLCTRFGTMVCMVCRGKKIIKEMADTGGWNTGSVEEEEARLLLFGKGLVDELPGLGGVGKVVRAYGIGGLEVEVEDVVKGVDERGLGALGLMGYAQSRPGMFVETYVYGKANGLVADAEWDEFNMIGSDGEEYEDEYEYGDEEDDDEEEYGDEEGDKDDSAEESEKEDRPDPMFWRGAKIIHAM